MRRPLQLHRELGRLGVLERIPPRLVLRSQKIAELVLNLAYALRMSSRTMERLRELVPFSVLLTMQRAESYAELPQELRQELMDIYKGFFIVRKNERELWTSILNLADAIYSGDWQGTLPYPTVQVRMEKAEVSLILPERLAKTLSVPNGLRERLRIVDQESILEAYKREEKCILLAHYDPHGFAMLLATHLALRSVGVEDIDSRIGYEETGDYGKFWKRTFIRAVDTGMYTKVICLDLTIYSRNPQRTLDAIKKATEAGCKVCLIDHHLDTLQFASQMADAGAEIILSDIPSCFLGGAVTTSNAPYILLGALGDRDVTLRHPSAWRGLPVYERTRVVKALNSLSRMMLALSPPPKPYKKASPFPTLALVKSAQDNFDTFAKHLQSLTEGGIPIGSGYLTIPVNQEAGPVEELVPIFEQIGCVLIASQRLALAGRHWYQVLEQALQARNGAKYAIAGRYLPGSGFNFLVTKKWDDLALPQPLSFVRARLKERAIGHFGAFWLTLTEDTAVKELSKLVTSMNRYHGLPSRGVQKCLQSLTNRLLDDRLKKVQTLSSEESLN